MADSVWGKILDAVVTAAKATTLTGITTATNVVLQTAPTESTPLPSLPGVIIAPFGGERFGRGTNTADDIGYPCLVCPVAAGNETHADATLDARLVWRENLIDKFIHTRVSITSSKGHVFDQIVETPTAVDLGAWFDRNLFASPIIVVVWFRKTRRA